MTVCSPRITTALLPDYTDLDRFAQFHGWRDLPAPEKAVAIWRYVTDRETGLYPIQGIYEDPDPGPEFAFYDERDLIKVLNVHGHGYCGLLSPTLDGIFAHAGFEDGRIINMRENHHCVTEVLYDGEWHYFDVDLRGMLYRDNGAVATLEEACRHRQLWTDPPIQFEPFYPLDDKAAMFESFAQCKLTRMFHWYKNGHTMDFALRPGENLIRYWQPQGGRWHQPWPRPKGFNQDFLHRRFAEEPRGLKSKHRDWSVWTHGNGLLSYAPQLKAGYEDFERGVYESRETRLTSRGVESAAGGQAVFEVRTPYIIVGEVKDMGPPPHIEGAATVCYRSLGPLRLLVSTDGGLQWTEVERVETAENRMVDLTPHVLSTYGYLVRFDFDARSGLAGLALNTWVQVAPASLPRLFAGENPLHFATGDKHGYATTVKEIRLNLRDPVALENHAVRLSGEFQPLLDESRFRGEMVLRVDAKPGTSIQWLTAGGYFHTYLKERAAETANAIHYSTDGPDGPWRAVCEPRVPPWVEHWHYGADGEVVLDEPAETVYLKYRGDPGLNQVWIYAHCLAPNAPESSVVQVTHGYEIGGEMREDSFEFSSDADYEINCPTTPDNCYVGLAVPSQPTTGR